MAPAATAARAPHGSARRTAPAGARASRPATAPARAPPRAAPRATSCPRTRVARLRARVAVRPHGRARCPASPTRASVVRLTRGRLWIGVLATLLVGIVASNVMALSFGATVEQPRPRGRRPEARELGAARTARGHALRRAGPGRRRKLGLIVPAPGSIRYLEHRRGDAARRRQAPARRAISPSAAAIADAGRRPRSPPPADRTDLGRRDDHDPPTTTADHDHHRRRRRRPGDHADADDRPRPPTTATDRARERGRGRRRREVGGAPMDADRPPHRAALRRCSWSSWRFAIAPRRLDPGRAGRRASAPTRASQQTRQRGDPGLRGAILDRNGKRARRVRGRGNVVATPYQVKRPGRGPRQARPAPPHEREPTS